MQFFKINPANAKTLFEQLDCEKGGANIMDKKTHVHLLYIKDMHVGAANILKQDALSIGADLAVPTGTILAKEPFVNAVLIGSSKHFELLSKKEQSQPFGLKTLALHLKEFLPSQPKPTKIMGVINANDDSFYSQSRFMQDDAIQQIEQMIDDGVHIIDIGAVSSAPGTQSVSAKEELQRILPILNTINEKKLHEKIDFSIDSYEPLVIEAALDAGFNIVNDITGLSNDHVAQLVAQYNATVVIMHMQGTPQTMQKEPKYENIILQMDSFFAKRIQKAKTFGIEKIILDMGIGFGKTLEHNLTLLQNQEHFMHFGHELLIGASRKSMIDKIFPSIPQERLSGTLAIHLDAIDKGASIVRCHDVREHAQAIRVHEAIKYHEGY
ncbi:MAG: dihydropteroate synthase [Campylobacterota bacterium]|nr:dihydropteroate synthase [Campylobacterota bacterium]